MQTSKFSGIRGEEKKGDEALPHCCVLSVSNPVSYEEERRREGIVITPKV